MGCFSWCRALIGQDNSLRKQDGPWSWVVAICTMLQSWGIIGTGRSYGVFLPVLMKEFNEGRDQIALIASLTIGIMYFCALISSWLADNFGSRLICSIGHVLMIVAFTLSSTVYHKYAMFFTYSLFYGVGGSFIITSNVLCVVKYFKKHRSLALGMFAAGGALGTMTLPNIMQYLVDTIGWRNTFRVIAGGFVVLSALCTVYSPNVEAEQTADHIQRNQKRTSLRGMIDLSVWKVPKFVLAVVSIAVATFGFYSPSVHLVKFAEEIGISAVKASTLYTFFGIASLPARIVSGKLCDLSCIDASMVNVAAQLLAALTTFCLTVSTMYIHLVVVMFLYGMADGAMQTTSVVLFTSAVSPDKSATAFGQGFLAGSASSIAGPAIAGLLADITSTYTIAFYMCSGVMVAGAAVQLIPMFFRLNKTSRGFNLEGVHIDATSKHVDSTDKQREQPEGENRNEISSSNLGYHGYE